MTPEQQLQAIRERWRHVSAENWTILGDSTANDRVVVSVETDVPTSDAEAIYLAPQDVAALLRMIGERDAIIHDLMIDGPALARRAVAEFAAKAIEWVNHLEDSVGVYDAIVWLEEQTANYGGAIPDPLPPDQARQECERLRGVLRAIKDQVEDYLDTVKTHSSRALDVVTALGWLRAMASDEGTK